MNLIKEYYKCDHRGSASSSCKQGRTVHQYNQLLLKPRYLTLAHVHHLKLEDSFLKCCSRLFFSTTLFRYMKDLVSQNSNLARAGEKTLPTRHHYQIQVSDWLHHGSGLSQFSLKKFKTSSMPSVNAAFERRTRSDLTCVCDA